MCQILIENNEQMECYNQFPHKTAATKAGLGWIGKSALLVTPEYGSCVRLYTVFTDADFTKATPVNVSKCGNCQLCVDICPCNAIKNVGWHAGIDRDKIIDVYACNEYRLSFKQKIGRKYSCGFCIKVCKFGQPKN